MSQQRRLGTRSRKVIKRKRLFDNLNQFVTQRTEQWITWFKCSRYSETVGKCKGFCIKASEVRENFVR
jgi:hypothetical protein